MTNAASETVDLARRGLLGMAAVGAAAGFGLLGAAAHAAPAPASGFPPVKQVDAGPLSIGYVDMGPPSGAPVILLHGWPYDIYSFVDVAPRLAEAGHRVIIPYLRGYGSTVFRSAEAVRNAQQAALAVDVIALMDALKIRKAVLAGFDWGARTADIVAALWPDRCAGLVSVSGYLIGSQQANAAPLPPKAELAWWYQFYFATERGRLGYERNRHDFNKLIWRTASPQWKFDDATYERTARSFDNPDHVAIVIHNYRWRLAWPRARRATTPMSRSSPPPPRSRSPPSPWKATPMGRPIRSPPPTGRSSPGPTPTG